MLRNAFTLCLVFSAATVAPADLETARKAFATGDYKTAVAELLPLAEAGNAKAQGNLGWMYRNGVGFIWATPTPLPVVFTQSGSKPVISHISVIDGYSLSRGVITSPDRSKIRSNKNV